MITQTIIIINYNLLDDGRVAEAFPLFFITQTIQEYDDCHVLNKPIMTNTTPKLRRRILSLIYESFLLLAVLMIAGVVFHLIVRDTEAAYFMPLFQIFLLIVMGTYFVWFWTHGGQTLAMQTWKMRVVTAEGNKLEMRQAIIRYLLALACVLSFTVAGVLLFGVVGILFFCVGFLWALFDRDKQFLHDRLARTRVVNVDS